jgi:hypothetical protein
MRAADYHHWIYEDSKGILDPDPKFANVHQRLFDLAKSYPEGRELTISVRP